MQAPGAIEAPFYLQPIIAHCFASDKLPNQLDPLNLLRYHRWAEVAKELASLALRHGKGSTKQLLLDAVSLSLVVGNRGFDLIAVGMEGGQCCMVLGQVDRCEALSDLLRRLAELVPTNDALHRDAAMMRKASQRRASAAARRGRIALHPSERGSEQWLRRSRAVCS